MYSGSREMKRLYSKTVLFTESAVSFTECKNGLSGSKFAETVRKVSANHHRNLFFVFEVDYLPRLEQIYF